VPEYREIYQDAQHARAYHQLVSREDMDGNIVREIQRHGDWSRADVLDVGCGTGRMSALIEPHVGQVTACDRASAMLGVARTVLRPHTRVVTADNRQLPFAAASFDLVTAGWSFGHATEWIPGAWQADVRQAVTEMLRTVRPGGSAMIFETMGSGATSAAPPTQALADCYALFEQEFGFERTVIATDYRFHSQRECQDLTGFFFGVAMEGIVQADGSVRLPEWTGVWHRHA
jgi:ubiquinone/menaquinone biosynthesis C-methylase UbiE